MKNVLFLVPEQIRNDYLGYNGNPFPVSPNIDALAKRGVSFSHCYSPMAKCTPSRIAVASGRYPHSGGYMGNVTKLRPEDPNLVRCFREQGYETMLFRKNHQMEEATLAQSYDHFFNKYNTKYDCRLGPDHSMYKTLYRGCCHVEFEDTLDANVAQKVAEEINRERDKPFFMWVSFWKTHPAFECVEPFFSMFDRDKMPLPPKDLDPDKPDALSRFRHAWGLDDFSDDNWRELLATYFGMMHELDTSIGTILDALQSSGKADDTLVVLWGDHGEFVGDHQMANKYDTAMYDCTLRVPLIFSGAGIESGKRTEAMTEAVDVMTTIADYCGVKVPANINGKSFLNVLEQPENKHRDSALAVAGVTDTDKFRPSAGNPESPYYPKNKTGADHPSIQDATAMVRTHNWKLVHRRLDKCELYDMVNDPRELKNLYYEVEFHDIRGEMTELLLERLLQSNPPPDRNLMVEPF